MNSPVSNSEDKTQPTQESQPKKGEPIEIPVPSKDQIERDFAKIAAPVEDDEDAPENSQVEPASS